MEAKFARALIKLGRDIRTAKWHDRSRRDDMVGLAFTVVTAGSAFWLNGGERQEAVGAIASAWLYTSPPMRSTQEGMVGTRVYSAGTAAAPAVDHDGEMIKGFITQLFELYRIPVAEISQAIQVIQASRRHSMSEHRFNVWKEWMQGLFQPGEALT